MSPRSLLIASAAIVSLAAATPASACGFGPSVDRDVSARVQVAQTTPQPAKSAAAAPAKKGDDAAAPAAKSADPQN